MTAAILQTSVHPDQPKKSWKILVIEDDARWRSLAEIYLADCGHRVVTAPDGQAGLAVAREHRPDFIFCDVDMPRLDGYGVLEALRKTPGLLEIPFVFLTGKSARIDQRRGMLLGADDYLTKPFQATELLEAMGAVMQKREAIGASWRQQADERSRELTAPWGHELLTPLNGILGAAFLIESEAATVGRAELKELAAAIRESAERQLALAHKLIRHFELEQWAANGRCERTATLLAAASVEDEARAAARTAGRLADLHVACRPALVRISPDWLRVVVAELVENAFKFSPRGTAVTVTGRSEGGFYRFAVTDAGPGLTAEERAGIGAFRQFGRARHEQQGLGLGLAMVRRIAELHQGTFATGPGPAGAGLCVTIELPLGE